MKHTGARAFWLSFFLTIAILLPLLGSFVIYSGWQTNKQQAEAAQKSQSGVPIGGATQQNDVTVLVAVAAEKPGFVLMRLNALENRVDICPVAAQSVLLSPGGTVLLADSYTSAGPARAAALLAQTLNIQIDHYIAITPETLGKVWGQLTPPRVNLSGLLEKSELDALGLSADPVMSLAPAEATAFMEGQGLPPARLARVRAAVWEAALRQQLDNLATTIPAALRKNSGSLLTDFTVTDFYTMEETFSWLAKGETEFSTEPIPGRYDQASGRYEFGEDSIALAKKVFVAADGETPQTVYATPTPVNDPLSQAGESDTVASPSPTPAQNQAEATQTPAQDADGAGSAGVSPTPSPSLPPQDAAQAGSLE